MVEDRQAVDGRFPTTRWSLVARAADVDPAAKREALAQILTRYLPALHAHLRYGKRLSAEAADDLLQDFVASKVLERDLIARAEQRLGKFRTFLLTALDRFLIDGIRRQAALRRAPGGGPLLSLAEWADAAAAPEPAGDAFDVAWARRVLAETLRRMQAECRSSDRMDVWGVFEGRLLEPSLTGSTPVDYDQLVRQFAFQSPAQAANVLITAKRMFARIIRSVVAEYAADDEEVEQEIRDLREILARA